MLFQKLFTKFMVFIVFFMVVGAGYMVYDNSDMGVDFDEIEFLKDVKLKEDVKNVSNKILQFNLNRDPKLSFVSATEYTKGDGTGSTIIKLVDWRGNWINTTCYEEILYPNKSIYISWTEMNQHPEYSNYYMDFAVPEPLGIYDQEVRCLVGNKNVSLGKGFHVSNISNVIESKIDSLRQDIMVSVT